MMKDKERTREQSLNELAAPPQQAVAVETAETQRQEAEELLRALTISSPIGIYITQEERFQLVNPQLARLAGYSEDEMLSIGPWQLILPDDRSRVRENALKMLKGERSSPYEYRYTNKSGETGWVIETVASIRFRGKRAVLGNFMDITERKRVEEALHRADEQLERRVQEQTAELTKVNESLQAEIARHQQTEQLLKRAAQEWRDTFDAVSDAIFLTDRENKVIRCNRSLTDLLGKPFSQIIGHHCYQLIHGTSEPIAGCLFQRLRNTLRRETTILPLGDRWLNVAADPLLDESGGVSGTIHIMSDITVLKKAEEKLEQSLKRLQNTLEGTISALAKMAETRDLYTAGHQQRVAQLASAIAREMGFPPEQIEGLRIAALLHDIGKISVPAEILSKPGQLTKMEFSIIKTHPEVGYDILKTIDFPYPVSQIVLQHHERMNGSGYPQGLRGEDILREARILAVADVVEAISSHRPYRAAPGVNKAIETISQSRGILYDAGVVDTCLRLFTEKGFQFE